MKRQFRFAPVRGQVWILAGGGVLALLAAASTFFAIWSSRSVTLREWDQRLLSVSHMLAAHAGQSIGAADLVLRSIADNVNEYRVDGDQEIRWIFSSRHTFDMLRGASKGLPQIDVVTVAAKDGTVLNFSREFPAPPINLIDRDYFQAHLNDPSLDVYLSKPVQNRGNGGWTFYLARKIRSASGDMLGLVLTGLHTRYYSDFYASTGVGLDRISLLRHDGSLLSRFSAGYALPDGPPEPAQMLERLEMAPSGSLFVPDPAGRGFSELAAFARSPDLPVAVAVSASRDRLLREWESEAGKFAIEGGAMTALLLIVTAILWRLVGQLEAARNQALSAMVAKTRFASNVSHELRTPMNVIIGGSHQLMQTDLSPESQRYAGLVASSAQQLMVLINDILDYSYYEARHFRIEPAPFDPRALAGEAIDMARILAPDAEIAFDTKVSAGVPAHVLGDAARIKQIVLNLVSNAVKYTEAGAICIAVDYADGALAIDVSDTGRGVAPEDMNRIFEPFERGRSAQARPGTGLGLTICKKLVEAMKGTISVRSAPGRGSTFQVVLPAPAASALPGPTTQAREARASRRLEILVAEDVAPSRLLLTAMLEKLGHGVVAVENGREAVNEIQARDFDLVLMDLQMPELDGLAATAMIRAMPGPKSGVPVIAVSANADFSSESGLRAVGFNDVVMKPVTPARLKFVLSEAAAAA